jgi:hypothetical protein
MLMAMVTNDETVPFIGNCIVEPTEFSIRLSKPGKATIHPFSINARQVGLLRVGAASVKGL